jgi:hypothetical protein
MVANLRRDVPRLQRRRIHLSENQSPDGLLRQIHSISGKRTLGTAASLLRRTSGIPGATTSTQIKEHSVLLDSLKKLLDLKASEQALVDDVVHDLQLANYKINPLSAADLAAKQAEAAASATAEKNATEEGAAASRIPAGVT